MVCMRVQVRLVIWKCKDVVSMDWASGLNDLFVKAWCEGCEPQVCVCVVRLLVMGSDIGAVFGDMGGLLWCAKYMTSMLRCGGSVGGATINTVA